MTESEDKEDRNPKKKGCVVAVAAFAVVVLFAVAMAVLFSPDPCTAAMQEERIVERINVELAAGKYPAADPASLTVGELDRVSATMAFLPFRITYKAELLDGLSAAVYRDGGGPWGPESSKTAEKRFSGHFDDACELQP